ncbi:hypothetical protein TorRG33x02_128270 [Trema orientale]|uniref:Uncharacterized protein n=1 Tax=Trema orientale TaxID=63057 RepID=A0A2P5F0E3_TREOI|nr:hypothetical protein TorRG33x02_128270 [Trema orientale]
MRRGGSTLTYLGVFLFAGSPKRAHFQPILDKIFNNFENWKGMSLSMAGRVSLVNSVIMGQLSYSFQVHRWPISLLKDLISTIQNFLWSGSIKDSKPVIVSWWMCCKPKQEGGLGLRDPRFLNLALLKKLSWSLLTDDSFVYKFLRGRFFSTGFTVRRFWKSSIWSGLKSLIQPIIDESIWAPGINSKVRFWTDNWLGSPLVAVIDFDVSLEPPLDSVIGDVSTNAVWSLPISFINSFPHLAEEIRKVVFCDKDTFIWRHSSSSRITCAEAYLSLAGPFTKERWGDKFWASFIPPSRSIFF